MELKQTPLTLDHKERGARLVEFAGWLMPVQFVGLREEHNRVRDAVGLFDVSHMGEIRIQGPRSLETVQHLTTKDASRLAEGQAQYSLFLNEKGGIIDDLIVYCLAEARDY